LNFFNDLSSKKELYLLFIKRAEPINNHFLMFMKIYLEVVFFCNTFLLLLCWLVNYIVRERLLVRESLFFLWFLWLIFVEEEVLNMV